MKRDVILVTDGDKCAKKAIETATTNVGGRCISRSAGNPTELTGEEIVEYIKQAKHDPVVVMVDDMGDVSEGAGEKAMDYIINCEDINILGVVAVASNTPSVDGVRVDFSIDQDANVIPMAVDKDGKKEHGKVVQGDTVDVLNHEKVPIIVGIGDPGKMEGKDRKEIGAPIMTKALQKIIDYNEKRRA